MNGREIERLLSLLDVNNDEVLDYVREHKEEILQSLREKGMATVPAPNGESIILRPAALAGETRTEAQKFQQLRVLAAKKDSVYVDSKVLLELLDAASRIAQLERELKERK